LGRYIAQLPFSTALCKLTEMAILYFEAQHNQMITREEKVQCPFNNVDKGDKDVYNSVITSTKSSTYTMRIIVFAWVCLEPGSWHDALLKLCTVDCRKQSPRYKRNGKGERKPSPGERHRSVTAHGVTNRRGGRGRRR
jgi:hypothetical protein